MKLHRIESESTASIEIQIFDALSSSYRCGKSDDTIFKWILRPGSASELSIAISIVSLALFFVALFLEDKNASLAFLLILVMAILIVQIIVMFQTIKETFWVDRKNLLLSSFRKTLIADQERVAMLEVYPTKARVVLKNRLQSGMEVENSRLNLLVGFSRGLGIFPALAAVYGAYVSVFPEDVGIAFDNSAAITDQLIAKLGIFSMAAIVGIYIGACASEAALVRVRSMIQCLDAANESDGVV